MAFLLPIIYATFFSEIVLELSGSEQKNRWHISNSFTWESLMKELLTNVWAG
jgi:hypothetical protein